MKIAAVQPISMGDFPGRVAAVVFTRGCNFRCPYCHNPGLIGTAPPPGSEDVKIDSLLSFLEQRRGRLNGVVISGGEPALQEGLAWFIRRLRQLELAVKLDTNGSRPEVLEMLMAEGLVDYIAMDIKAPPEKYQKVAACPVNIDDIKKSIRLIIAYQGEAQGFDYEFRTTAALSLLNEEDIISCGRMAQGARRFILQPVKNGWDLSPPAVRLEEMAGRLRGMGIAAHVRNS